MPTGYTAGILDGTTKNFKQFALLCARNFGATLHMRDESLDAEYKPDTPSDYHSKRVDQANAVLSNIDKITDQELIEEERESLKSSIESYKQSKLKSIQNKEILEGFLEDAINFKPPTPEHDNIQDFMVTQIRDTIKFDGEFRYYDDKLVDLEAAINNLNADDIRSKKKAQAYKDLAYHAENYNKELKRCEDSNRWVEQLVKAL